MRTIDLAEGTRKYARLVCKFASPLEGTLCASIFDPRSDRRRNIFLVRATLQSSGRQRADGWSGAAGGDRCGLQHDRMGGAGSSLSAHGDSGERERSEKDQDSRGAGLGGAVGNGGQIQG